MYAIFVSNYFSGFPSYSCVYIIQLSICATLTTHLILDFYRLTSIWLKVKYIRLISHSVNRYPFKLFHRPYVSTYYRTPDDFSFSL